MRADERQHQISSSQNVHLYPYKTKYTGVSLLTYTKVSY